MFFFFFNVPTTPEIYTLSLHDALPIYRYPDVADLPGVDPGACHGLPRRRDRHAEDGLLRPQDPPLPDTDRKSTRLNSSHANISYAVFCLKKKITHRNTDETDHN